MIYPALCCLEYEGSDCLLQFTTASLCPFYHLKNPIVPNGNDQPKVPQPETGESGNLNSADFCDGSFLFFELLTAGKSRRKPHRRCWSWQTIEMEEEIQLRFPGLPLLLPRAGLRPSLSSHTLTHIFTFSHRGTRVGLYKI